jgi:hypothetical protein
MKIRLVGVEVLHADRQKKTDTTKLLVAFAYLRGRLKCHNIATACCKTKHIN